MTHISEVLGGDWMDEITRKHEEALKQILEDIQRVLNRTSTKEAHKSDDGTDMG